MNSFPTISAILRGKWLIEPLFAESQGPIIAGLINGHTELAEPKEDKLLAYAVPMGVTPVSRYSLKYDSDSIPENSIAVIPLKGSLMKASQMCGPMGMAEIGELIKKADAHKNINKIVLHVDSPGGTVDGTEALGDIILACETKTVAFVDGLMCSAALWIGTCCDEVIASTETDEIGSVGVLLSFMDIQPYWESLGVKFHTITASSSPDKVQRWKKLQAGEYDEYRKEVLDVIDEKFMSVVRTNRPEVKDEHLTGKVFFAKDVMGVFVDAIGTLDEILSEPIGSAEGASLSNNQNSNSMKKLTALVAVLALADLQLEADKDGGLFLNAEQLEAFNTALEASDNVDADVITQERDDALAAQQTAEGSLETANTRITELETQLEDKPGAKSATANKETDANKKESVNDEFADMANASELYNSIKD